MVPDSGEGAASTGSKLARSAGLVSIGVMVSRVLGLVREQVLAYLLPTRLGLDAFYAAFRIPNLLRDMFGEGALSKAFVATFAEIESEHGRRSALSLASGVLNLLVLAIGLLTLGGMWFAEDIVWFLFPGAGFDVAIPAEGAFGFETKRELTVFLTRLMFPFIFLVSVAALVMGILNSVGHFLIPALASSWFNLGSITVGVLGYFLVPRWGYHPSAGLGIGVLAGGALQLLWQLPSLFRVGYRHTLHLPWRDPWVRKVLRLFGPGALIASTVQINLMVNSYFASFGEAWLSWIVQAFRVLHLPIGLVGVAVSVATLPMLSRSAARDDAGGFKDAFSYSSRLVVLFTLPAMVGLLVLAEPIVRLIYEQGRFTANDTLQVAAALRFYSLGLLSFAAVKIVTDGFYALQDIRIPTIIALGGVVTNAGLNWLFVARLGMDHRGLALGTSCTMTVSCILLWAVFRRRRGPAGIGGRSLASLTMRVLMISLVMGGATRVTCTFLDAWMGHADVASRIIQVGGSITVAFCIFYGGCKLLRVAELEMALTALRKKGKGSRHG